MRARARMSAAPLAIATRLLARQHVGKARRTSTRSEKPITFIARAAAPTLPAWLVLHQHEAGRVGGRGGIGRLKFATRRGILAAARSLPPPAAPHARSSSASTPMSQALHPMLNIAVKAARAAGAIINRAALDLDLLKVNTKAPNDFVTEVDHAAERVDHRHAARAPTPATASWPRNRAARTARSTATTSGSSIRWTAPPTSSTACRSTRCRSRWPFAARCSRPWSTTRRATTCSTPPRAAAPSSTTGACASPSASGWPIR